MVAPLRRKNTLELTGFAFVEDGFRYKGQQYRLDDVVETARFRHRLETRVLLVGSDFTHSISVIFSMRTGETIQLTEQPTLFSGGRPRNVERIEEIFETVSSKTFEGRLEKYLKQLEANQFFAYSGWRFYPSNRTIVNMETQQTFSTTSVKLLRSYGFIEVQQEADGIASTMGRAFRGKVGINTLRDTDVFFKLLDKFFALRWHTNA
jgi:hypothetical protein